MVNFNTLIPALTITFNVNTVLPIGSGALSTGSSLILGHVTGGTLVSMPGFSIPINATLGPGDDWPTIDPDQKHARPDSRVLATTDDGELLEVVSSGIQVPTPELLGIIQGKKEGSLSYGSTYSVFVVAFRTGSKKYKELENSIFVGSETVRSLPGGRRFLAGLKVSQVVSTKTDVKIP